MDHSRLRELSGIAESIVTPVNAPDGEKHRKSATKANAKINKTNNKIPKAKSAKDSREQDVKGDIDNDVVASLDDVDDSGIEVKDGKKDVNKHKVVRKGERLTFTISIDDRGVPKIDDETDLETMDVEKWGESAEVGAEGYIVVSNDQEFGMRIDESRLVFGERPQASVFETAEEAFAFTEHFQGSKVCKLVIEEPEQQEQVAESSEGVNRGRLRQDIQDRLDMGLEVRSNVIVQGKSLEGKVTKVGDGFIMVTPHPRTAHALGIKQEPQMVRVDFNALQWSDDASDTVVGSGSLMSVSDDINMDQAAPEPGRETFNTIRTESEVKPGSLLDRVQKIRNRK